MNFDALFTRYLARIAPMTANISQLSTSYQRILRPICHKWLLHRQSLVKFLYILRFVHRSPFEEGCFYRSVFEGGLGVASLSKAGLMNFSQKLFWFQIRSFQAV